MQPDDLIPDKTYAISGLKTALRTTKTLCSRAPTDLLIDGDVVADLEELQDVVTSCLQRIHAIAALSAAEVNARAVA